ncbi:MAG: LAGLIDADG family homing endonuclease [Patescibacteria group bacterium]
MRRNDITPKIIKELYYKKHLSKKDIASILKCNVTTIHKKMMKFDIATRTQAETVKIAMQKKIIEIPKPKLKSLYSKEKLTITKIGAKLGYDRSIIKRELKRHKIPIRTLVEINRSAGEKRRIKKSILVKLYYKDCLTQKRIGEKLNRHMGSIVRLMKRYGLKTRTADKYHTKYPKYNFSGNLEEKAYLIGFRTGDLDAQLSPSKHLITVGSTSTKAEQINLFKNLFEKYGHIWISKVREDGNRVFVIRLNLTFGFLLPKRDSIPKWIRENHNYFLSFLAGYADAEGCIYIAKNNVAGFKLASYDKNVLKQTHKQLLKIGIKCNPPRIHVRKGHKKSDGGVYKNDEWSFVINKKSSLLSFLQLLKPRLKHQKRLKDAKIAEQNIIERNKKALSKKSLL